MTNPSRTFLRTTTGADFDLLKPDPKAVRWVDVAEQLAKENRYNGATPAACYSVAEHCVRGADLILKRHHDATLAAYFLLHDGHEAYSKDDTTPKKRALADIASREFGILAPQVMAAFAKLTDGIDAVIHEAAGLAWPMNSGLAAAVKRVDQIMLEWEWRDLMGSEPPYAFTMTGQLPTEKITPFQQWQDARNEFHVRCRSLLPAFLNSREPMKEGIWK